MSILVVIIHVIVSLVLISVILLQAGRGQGLTGAAFGGGNVQSLFGTKGSVFLQKATTVCAAVFMLTCITLDIMEARRSRSLLEAGRPAAPVDVDRIQQALERIRAEAAEEAGQQEPVSVPTETATEEAGPEPADEAGPAPENAAS